MSDEIDDAGFDEEGPEDSAAGSAAPVNYEPIKTDAEGEEAEETEEAALGAYVNPSVDECPVVPLGHYGDKIVFAMPEGEIRHVVASKVGPMLRADIYASERGAAFLTYWRDKKDKFHLVLAAIWLVRKCREAPYWDTNRTTRSLGVWPGPERTVALHLGDQVWSFIKGKIVKKSIADMMREPAGPLYKIAPRAPRPAKPAKVEVGQWVTGCLSQWQFEPIGRDGLSGLDVLAGWLMGALLGGVAPFRGHVVIYGAHGAGKTSLIMLMHAFASALAGELLNSFSEAGFRADLAGMARPVFLDETEATGNSHGPGVVEQVIAVLRRMSTGDGSKRKQGGGENGGATTQTAVGSALLGAITPPKLEAADGSRIIEIRLRPLPTPDVDDLEAFEADMDARLEAMREEARRLAPALLGRALVNAARYRADVAMIKAALRRTGESPRSADLVAMVAAGRRLLLHDDALDEAQADKEVAFWRPLLVQRQATEVITNVGADALSHLLAFETSVHREDRKVSLGLMIERALGDERSYITMLKGYGLQIWSDGDDPAWETVDGGPQGRPGPWLVVANNHPQLKRIFEPTRWADWRRALGFLDDLGPDYATWPTKPLRYGAGLKQRGLAVPLSPLLDRFSTVGTPSRSAGVPVERSGHGVDFNDD